jgi:hypothetical protein
MVNDDFVEQAVHRSTHRGDKVENICASGVPFEPTLDCGYLPRNPFDAGEQVAFLLTQVPHRIPPYSILNGGSIAVGTGRHLG